jgi:Immunity protein Imm1
MVLILEWIEGFSDEVHSRDVACAADLDRLLDLLTERAKQLGTPFSVSLAHTDATTMTIVVGADLGVVEWTRPEPWSCLVGVADEARAADDGAETMVFAGNGQYSELPRWMWVDVARARDAIRHYFTTRELADFVRWTGI